MCQRPELLFAYDHAIKRPVDRQAFPGGLVVRIWRSHRQAQKNWLPHEKLLPSSLNRTSDLRISNNFPTVLRSTI